MKALQQGVLELELPVPGAGALLMEAERDAAERAVAGQRWRKVVGRDGREMRESGESVGVRECESRLAALRSRRRVNVG